MVIFTVALDLLQWSTMEATTMVLRQTVSLLCGAAGPEGSDVSGNLSQPGAPSTQFTPFIFGLD